MSSLKRLFLFLSIVSALVIALFAVFLRYRDDKMPCIFCDIVAKKSSTELVYEDEVVIDADGQLKFVLLHQCLFQNFVAFKDIKPASKFHFLVIPKKHIPNVKSLTLDDKEMGKNFNSFKISSK